MKCDAQSLLSAYVVAQKPVFSCGHAAVPFPGAASRRQMTPKNGVSETTCAGMVVRHDWTLVGTDVAMLSKGAV